MLDLTNLKTIKSILKTNQLWAKKKLGQNFLVAKNPLDQLIKSADIRDDEVVVEIGPGLGTLTQELAQKAKLVLAIEKDYKLVDYLRKYFKNAKNVKIIHEDILKFPISNLACRQTGFQFPINFSNPNDQNSKLFNNGTVKSRLEIEDPRFDESGQCNNVTYKVVANLPYNITSPVIRKFLEADNPTSPRMGLRGAGKPSSMVLTVQKEVAERICAKPGDSNRGILTVMVEFYGRAKIIEIVDRSCFWPVPKVDSAIIKIQVTNNGYLQLLKVAKGSEQPQVTLSNRESSELRNLETTFFRLVKAGFSAKRRQIHNSLAASLKLPKDEVFSILEEAEINPLLRAEDLSLDDWLNLGKIITGWF